MDEEWNYHINDRGTVEIDSAYVRNIKGNVKLPERIEGRVVTDISESAFSGTGLVQITFPSGIQRVKKGAFSGCEELRRVILPDGLNRIEDYAFYGCSSLYDIKFPNTLQYIGKEAFGNTNGIMEIKLPSSLIEIKNDAFVNSSLGSIKVSSCNPIYVSKEDALYNQQTKTLVLYPPNRDASDPFATGEWMKPIYYIQEGTRHIAPNAFNSLKWETYVKLPQTMAKVDKRAFCNAEKLKGVILSNNIVEIEEEAFSYCSELETITLPDSLLSIADKAFENCIGLKKLYIPENVTRIGEHIFGYFLSDAWLWHIELVVKRNTYAARWAKRCKYAKSEKFIVTEIIEKDSAGIARVSDPS